MNDDLRLRAFIAAQSGEGWWEQQREHADTVRYWRELRLLAPDIDATWALGELTTAEQKLYAGFDYWMKLLERDQDMRPTDTARYIDLIRRYEVLSDLVRHHETRATYGLDRPRTIEPEPEPEPTPALVQRGLFVS